MSRFKPFVLGSLAGAALVYASLQYHLIRSDDGFYLIQRTPQASMGLAFADVRGMSDEALADLPELARAMNAHSLKAVAATDENRSEENEAMFDLARERLKSTAGDWVAPERGAVPRPPDSGLDAPLWNPFAADEDENDSLGASSHNNDASQTDDNWPFDEDSPFAEITDELDQATDAFVTRSEELANQFDRTWEDDSEPDSENRRIKPFDFAVDTQPQPEVRPTQRRQRDELNRDRTLQNTRDAVSRRAREIYERSRSRSADSLDRLIDRSQSRASSVIDELVGPREGESAIDRAATNREPQRYRRGN